MTELAMLANIQRVVHPEGEITRQLHVMAQARESSPVIDRRSNHCAIRHQLHSSAIVKNCHNMSSVCDG